MSIGLSLKMYRYVCLVPSRYKTSMANLAMHNGLHNRDYTPFGISSLLELRTKHLLGPKIFSLLYTN